MKRYGPLPSDVAKARDWQRRSAERYAAKKRKAPLPRSSPPDDTPRPLARTGKAARRRRRNDAPWRTSVVALRGYYCRSCGATSGLECDHVMPRGQGGPSVVENGTMLCRSCHEAKTENRIQYQKAWLDPDQVAWLAEVGWARWEDDGTVTGRGRKHFAPEPRGRTIERSHP